MGLNPPREGYPWIDVMRQLSRCQLEVGYIEASRQTLDKAISGVNHHISDFGQRANWYDDCPTLRKNKDLKQLAILEYEASIAAAVAGDDDAAASHIESAVKIDIQFAQLALGEPFFEGHELIIKSALAIAIARENRR